MPRLGLVTRLLGEERPPQAAMPSFFHRRSLRAALLLAYALIVGMDQGLHYFAHPEACHGVHAASSGCSCGGCVEDSPFARRAKAQLAAEQGSLTVRPRESGSHACCECAICQSLTQMVGETPTPPAAPHRLTATSEHVLLSELAVVADIASHHLARGPPAGVDLS